MNENEQRAVQLALRADRDQNAYISIRLRLNDLTMDTPWVTGYAYDEDGAEIGRTAGPRLGLLADAVVVHPPGTRIVLVFEDGSTEEWYTHEAGFETYRQHRARKLYEHVKELHAKHAERADRLEDLMLEIYDENLR